MKPLIDPINTRDGQFHGRNTQTGELATIVTPVYMNDTQGATRSLQQEVISLLTAAGIAPAEATNDQLLSALRALFLAADDSRVSGALQQSDNLSDVQDKAASLSNIGGVPVTRQINTHALSQDITLTAGDVAAVPVSGGTMTGELSTSNMDSYRIKAGDRGFFLRFDGSDFYVLKTAAGDPDGTWDGARPLRINAGDGRVYLGANTRIEGSVYAQDAFLQTDGNIYGSTWGGWLSNWISGQIETQINAVKDTAGDGWFRSGSTGRIIQAFTAAAGSGQREVRANFPIPFTATVHAVIIAWAGSPTQMEYPARVIGWDNSGVNYVADGPGNVTLFASGI